MHPCDLADAVLALAPGEGFVAPRAVRVGTEVFVVWPCGPSVYPVTRAAVGRLAELLYGNGSTLLAATGTDRRLGWVWCAAVIGRTQRFQQNHSDVHFGTDPLQVAEGACRQVVNEAFDTWKAEHAKLFPAEAVPSPRPPTGLMPRVSR